MNNLELELRLILKELDDLQDHFKKAQRFICGRIESIILPEVKSRHLPTSADEAGHWFDDIITQVKDGDQYK